MVESIVWVSVTESVVPDVEADEVEVEVGGPDDDVWPASSVAKSERGTVGVELVLVLVLVIQAGCVRPRPRPSPRGTPAVSDIV